LVIGRSPQVAVVRLRVGRLVAAKQTAAAKKAQNASVCVPTCVLIAIAPEAEQLPSGPKNSPCCLGVVLSQKSAA
jgi:uncharacterized membrane protein